MSRTLDILSQLPSEFMLGGHRIKVQVRDDTDNEKSGEWLQEESIIRLWPKSRTYDYMMATFYHELAHAVLDIFGRPEDSANEQLVDVLGQGLMQFAKTAKYPK